MSTLPQSIAFIFLIAAFVCSALFDVDNRKFWWVIGLAVTAGLLFALDLSTIPIKWHTAIGVVLAMILPAVFLMVGGGMAFHRRNAEQNRIKMVRLSRKMNEQFYEDILGKEDYEKYIASDKKKVEK